MFDVVEGIAADLRQAVARLDAAALEGPQAAALVEAFATVERLAVAGRTLAAKRVASTRVWQREGHRTPAQWLASKTGLSVGHALGALETAEHIQSLPQIKAAFCDGLLSESQAKEVAAAAAADPGAAPALLEAAGRRELVGLREECRRVRAAAEPDEAARYRRLRESRYLRTWTESDGAVRLSGRFAPDDGATVIASIRARANHIRRHARRRGNREAFEAHAADALVALVREGPGEAGARATVHLFVDHAALVRGHANAGERCEIQGVGPVPVAAARAMLTDSILDVLVTDGVDVKAVAHAGRTIPSTVRRGLRARDPVCVVPGCDEQHDLEIDHWRADCAWGFPAGIDDLALVCRWHHYLRTYCGYQLRGGTGRWQWITPDQAEGIRDAEPRPPPPR